MSKKTIATLVLVIFLAVPATSYAATQDDLLAQIQNLLRMVSSLQEQLRSIENNTNVSDFKSCVNAGNLVMESYPRQCAHNGRTFTEIIFDEPDASSFVCPQLSRNVSIGSSGADVSSLQRFLQSVGTYTYPVITGYYGTLTQQAVQQWQAGNNVVSFGSPDTTGFGVVGPVTRSAIHEMCSRVLPKPTICTLQYEPVCGQTPGICVDGLTGGYCTDGEIKTYGNSCQLQAAGAQQLYEGECRLDTATTAPNNCQVWNDGCNTCSRSYEGGPLACTKRACFWEGIPKCEMYFDEVEEGIPTSGIDFSASVNRGAAPLKVSFSVPGGYSCADGPDYEVDYGDGTRESAPSCSRGQHVLTHTYSRAGTYTATLYSIPSGFGTSDRTPQVAATEVVTVTHY